MDLSLPKRSCSARAVTNIKVHSLQCAPRGEASPPPVPAPISTRSSARIAARTPVSTPAPAPSPDEDELETAQTVGHYSMRYVVEGGMDSINMYIERNTT